MPDVLRECDLVLEGGGVKGAALVGAVAALRDRGYRFGRVAGTSAGAIVAAMAAADVPTDAMREFMTMNYAGVLDREAGYLGNAANLLVRKGLFSGRRLHGGLENLLADHGVRTFADLMYDDPDLRDNEKFRLCVIAADLTGGRLVRLPWDMDEYYHLDPEKLPVATAVHASSAALLAFTPLHLTTSNGVKHWIVDGGLLSVFPIGLFDRVDGDPPRRPTFGVRLMAEHKPDEEVHPIRGWLSYLTSVVLTSTTFYDQMHVDDHAISSRTVFVDTSDVGLFNIFVSKEKQDELYHRGYDGMAAFLDGSDGRPGFDFRDYVARYRRSLRGGGDARLS